MFNSLLHIVEEKISKAEYVSKTTDWSIESKRMNDKQKSRTDMRLAEKITAWCFSEYDLETISSPGAWQGK